MTNTAASTSTADLATTFVMFRLQQLVAARVPGLRQHGQPTLPGHELGGDMRSWMVP